jgi:hypothetical protein
MGISTNQQIIYFFAGYLRLAMRMIEFLPLDMKEESCIVKHVGDLAFKEAISPFEAAKI